MSRQLILASSSPRRQQLLEQVKIPFDIRKPDVDESIISSRSPESKVEQLAKLKADHVSLLTEQEVILAADTVVSYQGDIFEKPHTEEDAMNMLSALSGQVHEVYTGVAIRTSDRIKVLAEKTEVEFWPLSSKEIHHYISTMDPFDKAGAYGIQSIGATFVKRIIGDYYNVVGLPISRVVRELRDFSIYPSFFQS
ncbi:Maf family protein [Salinibacillus xinjiangensis]|uniref:dTTP/UTP pyrophosphatase n=1 Tax=Salinibacillus xinjiangensis TaxID=1229268 RepID=A0A6G1XBQ0_9BACI|nr:Maf family protein [Salinibacillus xinjiangensis]MRG88218.1 septum formation inhibitor Maf [Salinibacillus xinjiangensis]